jgi:hypothetical protein
MTTLRPKVDLKDGGSTPTGAVNRDIDSKLTDILSVKDFGAVGDGTTDDSVAFQNAYNAVTSLGIIYVPNGKYNVVTTPTGSKKVCWNALGALKPDGITPLSLPGTVISYQNPGYVNIAKSSGDVIGFAELNVERTVNTTGGTLGYVNAGGRFITTAGAGNISNEWPLLSILNNSSTQADASQNTAAYFQATKLNGGITIGSVVELIDTLPGPAVTSVTQELDLRAVGGDPNKSRAITQMLASSHDGNAAAVYRGLWITTDSNTNINNCIEFDAPSTFVNYIVSTNCNIKANGYTSLGTQGYAALSSSLFTLGKASTDGFPLMKAYTDGILEFQILQSGSVQNATNSYGAISDLSLKENIIDATPKLDDLSKVKIRNFNLRSDKLKSKQIGVIAQELETIFPAMIEEDSEGIKSVKYSIFVPMLIKAVQELNKKVTDLEEQVIALGVK